MIEMEVCQEYIGNIIPVKAVCGKGFVQSGVAMQVIVTKEFCILFIANTIVYQYEPLAIFNQQATHGPGT
jgi:hypothetical protein